MTWFLCIFKTWKIFSWSQIEVTNGAGRAGQFRKPPKCTLSLQDTHGSRALSNSLFHKGSFVQLLF